MVAAGQWAAMIPMACLAGILVVVAWNMAELHGFMAVFRTSRHDMAVLLATFLLTVLFDLIIAIEVGMVLAAFLFMKRMSDAPVLERLGSSGEQGDALTESELGRIPPSVMVYEINGPLFFGAAQTFVDTLRTVGDKHRTVVLRMRHVPFIDATGLHRLGDIAGTLRQRKVRLLLTEVQPEVKEAILKTGLLEAGAIRATVREALEA
ncbi:MAG TPA: STAS domain-containing protein [Flavobacteriales bacterium]|nr:STAS domain-containing protein [Flavobacteriales bacterium]